MEPLDRDIELATRAHRSLVDALDTLVLDGRVDMTSSSRLPGWTRGHVLTHVINSGDGHTGILRAALRGDVRAQYPHGVDGRDSDIEAGAGRPAGEQLADLRRSIDELEAAWAQSEWDGFGITPRGGQVPVSDLPFLRTREVAIHHVDLDIGLEFDDLPDVYVRLELNRMEMLWKARQPMGLTPVPEAALRLPPPDRLAWFTGRREFDGLVSADVF